MFSVVSACLFMEALFVVSYEVMWDPPAASPAPYLRPVQTYSPPGLVKLVYLVNPLSRTCQHAGCLSFN